MWHAQKIKFFYALFANVCIKCLVFYVCIILSNLTYLHFLNDFRIWRFFYFLCKVMTGQLNNWIPNIIYSFFSIERNALLHHWMDNCSKYRLPQKCLSKSYPIARVFDQSEECKTVGCLHFNLSNRVQIFKNFDVARPSVDWTENVARINYNCAPSKIIKCPFNA